MVQKNIVFLTPDHEKCFFDPWSWKMFFWPLIMKNVFLTPDHEKCFFDPWSWKMFFWPLIMKNVLLTPAHEKIFFSTPPWKFYFLTLITKKMFFWPQLMKKFFFSTPPWKFYFLTLITKKMFFWPQLMKKKFFNPHQISPPVFGPIFRVGSPHNGVDLGVTGSDLSFAIIKIAFFSRHSREKPAWNPIGGFFINIDQSGFTTDFGSLFTVGLPHSGSIWE